MGASPTNRTERLARIEQLLAHNVRGMRAVEIAQACGVDRRTIYRDVTLLNRAGIPVTQTQGRFYLDRTLYHANIRLSVQEVFALVLAASAQTRHSPHYNPYLAGALHKLIPFLPDELKSAAEVAVLAPARREDNAALQAVVEGIVYAWTEQRVVRLKYVGRSGKARSFNFAVYLVDCKPNGTLYVVGREMSTQRVYSLSLARITRLKLLAETFQRPANFDPRIYVWNYRGLPPANSAEIG